jgi:hypothetical protein
VATISISIRSATRRQRKDGAGFIQLESWLGEYDALFLRRNNADPLVLLPWRMWAALLTKIPRPASPKEQSHDEQTEAAET